MGKVAFIYPGQGAQKTGMGKDFYEGSALARARFDRASELVGFDMAALCFEPDERLDITEYTQAAMVTTCIAMTEVLSARGLLPDVTAGLSLGEYCALYTAGALSADDAIRLVRTRGILMQEAVPAGQGAMAAILGMEADKIEAVLTGMEGVWIANYNCPGQIVISGYTKAVQEANEGLAAAGAKRAVMLNVSGPFHSGLLKEAGAKLAKELESVAVKRPQIPYVANVTGAYVQDEGDVKPLLARQVSSSVRWQQSVMAMLNDGVDTFVEIGPGRTLAGFIKKITRDAKVLNVEKLEDIDKVAEALMALEEK